MAILQRMADPDAFPDDDPGTTSGDEEIESKLESLDLALQDSADTTALWDALSPAQRDAFTKAMQDPNNEYDREECRRVLAKAVPFMIDKKSTTRLDSVDDAIQYVQSRVDESLIHILPDVITLIRPSMVTEIPSSSLSLPSSNKPVADPKLCVVLADVSGLYTNLGPPNGPDKGMQTNKASGSTRDKGTVQKVLFYAAHVQAAPRDRLSSITHELYRASSSSMASSRQEDSISENITLLI
ncbi:hypothetical protein FRC17_002936 [Serendipita sp. 399]|nr:hypothetical protein FRC17_002936 [Serendipita sp. 399]